MTPYAYVEKAWFPEPRAGICAPCGTELVRNVVTIERITVQDNAILIQGAHSTIISADTEVLHQCAESYETATDEHRPILSFLKESDYAQLLESVAGIE